MAVVSINYDEGSTEPNLGYKSVSFSSIKESKIFNSGDFVKDWYDCTKYIIKEWEGNEIVSNSSSVDHFIMDGAKFDSAWLSLENAKAVLKYNYCECIELFVLEGTQPTWEELKIIVKDGI